MGRKKDGKEKKEKKIGVQIGEVYCDIMAQLFKIIEFRPDVDSLKPKLQELQEKTINQLVDLGKIKETLEEGPKGMANYDIIHEMRNVTQEDFKEFTNAINHYRPLDNDLANMISSFNTITQYADFDL